MRAVILMMVICLGFPTHAQVMDDSDIEIGKIVTSGLVAKVPDPYSTQIVQIRKARSEENVFCGLLNTKNNSGGYTGFVPFTVDAKTGLVYLNTDSRCN